MDNKTKVKVAVVIGIVVLAVIFILMVVFVKGNRKPKKNNNIPTKTSNTYENNDNTKNEVDNENKDEKDNNDSENTDFGDVVSLGIRNRYLVKLDSDLNEEEIKKVKSGYLDYCYGDNRIYELVEYEQERNADGIKIIEINLEDEEYSEKTILETADYGIVNDIEYYSGKIYFISENGTLVEYSISEDYFNNLSNENEVTSFAIDKDNNCIYEGRRLNGENPGVYRYSFTENDYNQLITLNELPEELVVQGKSLVVDVKEVGKIYVYNIENPKVTEVGDNNSLGKMSSQISLFDNYVLYTDGSKIDLKNESGESYQDGWYNLGDNSIADISMITNTKLQTSRYDEDGKISKCIIIDLTSGEAKEKEEVYSNLILIK